MLIPKFTRKDFEEIFARKLALINQAIIERMQKVGEESVNRARQVGDYKDHTSNLRNSIGYILVVEGTVINSYFPGSGEGASTGQAFAESKAAEHPTGYALIVVAGMEYALNVESFNYDVLSSTEHWVEANFKSEMDKIIANIGKMN